MFYHPLFNAPYLYPLYLLQLGFTIWMLVDAGRRRPEYYWFWIILGFQPLGAWAYFFMYKVKELDLGGNWLAGLFQRRVSLEELHYRVQQSPTLANHLALAERLIEKGDHAAAVPHLNAVLARESDHCQALFALATCHTRLGEPKKAVPLLEKVNARDRTWGHYAAWHLLIDAQEDAGDGEAALATGRQLVKQVPTLEHHCLLAERLLDNGKGDEARELLEKGLEDYEYAPPAIRRRNRRWAGEAQRLLKRMA